MTQSVLAAAARRHDVAAHNVTQRVCVSLREGRCYSYMIGWLHASCPILSLLLDMQLHGLRQVCAYRASWHHAMSKALLTVCKHT